MRWIDIIRPEHELDDWKNPGPGVFVGAELSEDTVDHIKKFIKQNKIPNACEDFHVTVILDKENTFPYKPVDLGFAVSPATFQMMHLGPESRALVIKFDCPELSQIHEELKDAHDVHWDWPDYKPHVTLSYDCPVDITPEPPMFPLNITNTYVRPWEG